MDEIPDALRKTFMLATFEKSFGWEYELERLTEQFLFSLRGGSPRDGVKKRYI
ncbi:MAG: hypothetical protein JSW56_04225 [Deltaproteobacteria bacterium]|nr:MAG: hypothetical protein JSW56_04225 [Deltaproteobacteria bacterium]